MRREMVRAFLVGAVRAVGGAAIGGFLAITLVAVYFFVMPGSWFLRTDGRVVVSDSLIGQSIPFTWCREPAFGIIKAEAVRTFYRADGVGKYSPDSDYRFPVNIEETDDPCQELSLKADKQPQQAGTYYFVTDLTWNELSFEKHLRYKSDPYTLDATPESLRLRIKQLEDEVDGLRKRLVTMSPSAVTSDQVFVLSSPATSNLTSRTNEPTTSAPPEPGTTAPVAAAQPVQPQQTILSPLLQPTINALDAVLLSATGVLR